MDLVAIASTAVAALGGFFARAATGVGWTVGEEAITRLQQLVSERLRATWSGTRALDQLIERPEDPAARDAMALTLADETARDPTFAATLDDLVRQLPPQVTVGVGSTAGGATTVVTTGGWDNRPGVVAGAGATIDQSRRTRISTNGWLAILAVIFVAMAGTTTRVTAKSGSCW